jgi:NAD(P)-dependent dehydrogenase (short-subunit alcohol dehydrogenase family)
MESLKDSSLIAERDLKAQQSSPKTLQGRVAIISSSSSGIGKAIAAEISCRGASVVLNYPFPQLKDEGEAVASNLPGQVIAVCADMGSTAGPAALVEAAMVTYGRIDILVNNAALAVNKPVEEQTLGYWDLLVNINA